MVKPQSDECRIGEILLVVMTGLAKFLFVDLLQVRTPFIILTSLIWLAFISWKIRNERIALRRWQIVPFQVWPSLRVLLPVTLLLSAVMALVGQLAGWSVLGWNVVPVLLLYPLWGIFQQFLVLSLCAGNIKGHIKDSSLILLTSLMFALIHYPDWILVATTAVMGAVYTALFLRNFHVIALGLMHGWLGAFFYYTILGRDAWAEFVCA